MRGLLIGRICALAASLFLCTAAFAADPQISSFVDSPDPVSAGGKVTYTARVSNSALDDAVDVVLSVPVPSGAAFVSASAPCVLAGATVRCSLGTLGGVGTDVRDFDFVFRALNPGPSVLTATASVSADNDSNAANNTASQTTTVISGGDLSLSKTATPSPVISGAQITYTLTASNAGPNASGDIVITDALPPAVTYVSSTGSGWSCSHSANLVTCTHAGPHAANVAIPSLSIVGTVTASSGTVTNAATVAPAASGGITDPDLTNNTASVSTPVVPAADLAIASKSVTSASPATAGTIVTFRIQPRNNGPVTAVNAVVTDVLPAGWTYVSASGPNWSCGDIGQSVTCARASFPVSATDDITVSATAPSNAFVGAGGTSYSNTATIASDTVDSNPSNNSASVGIVVRPDGADLRLSKSTTPNPVAVGGTLTSTIVVSNSGPRTATGPLRVVELLSNETFVSASGSGWTALPALAQEARLAPVDDRITDGAIQRDHETYETLQARLKALNDKGRPIRDYQLSKAQCWLDVSFHEYTRNDRSSFPQEAMSESEKLAIAMERALRPISMETPLVNGAARLRPDLWSRAEALKSSAGFRCAEQKIACAEVELVHAGNEYNQQQWRHANPYIQIAEDLMDEGSALAERCPEVVAPLRVAAPSPVPPPATRETWIAAQVVFRFDRSDAEDIMPASMEQIESLLRKLETTRSIVHSVRLIGHADRLNGTGEADYNWVLSQKRGNTLRNVLSARGVDPAIIEVSARGDAQQIEPCKASFRTKAELEDCLLPNRRVEIEIVTSIEPPK